MKLEINHEVIDRIYKDKFEKLLFYRWIQKSIQTNSKDPRPKRPRYQITWVNHMYRFILTVCTSTTDINLVWEDFSTFGILSTRTMN